MLEKLNKSAENKGTTQINYGCIRKQIKNNNKRGNEKRGKKPKLMVQQPAREAMEKNKKKSPTTGRQRNTQTGYRQSKRKGIWL